MDYEKKYKEALERARYWEKCPTVWSSDDICQKIFPELAESEDERIRKELLNAFQETEDSLYMVLTPHRRKSFIAWLEKQGEQKAINDTDEGIVKAVADTSILDMVEPNPTLSEDDDQYLLVCKNALAKYQTTDKWDANVISRWLENKLKSLKPQSRWKPSAGQLEALNFAKAYLVNDELRHQADLLYNDLKKLKEE